MLQLTATKLLTIADVLSGWHLVSASAGPGGELLLLAAEHAPRRPTSATGRRRNKPGPPLAYRIYTQRGSELTVIDLPPTQQWPHIAQPLGPEHWLTVCPRSSRVGNASVYSSNGHQLRSFHLGDAIQDVQTTRSGLIWTSFFDEGVFGDDTGQEGAMCLNQERQPLFKYNQLAQQQGLPFMADCYAMNVCSDMETWLYFYTDFPLVHIVHQQVERVWDSIPVHGAHAFAIAGHLALFGGSYQQHQSLFLVTLDKVQVEEAQPVNDQGMPIAFTAAFGRGSSLYLRDEQSLFSIDLA